MTSSAPTLPTWAASTECSEIKLGLLRRLAAVVVQAELLEARMARGEPIDIGVLCTLALDHSSHQHPLGARTPHQERHAVARRDTSRRTLPNEAPRHQHRRGARDRNLLGAALGDATSWSPWIAILRAAFGLPLDEQQQQVFNRVAGGRDPPSQRVKELWSVCGRRSGKTRMAAAISVYIAAIEQHKLAPGEVGYVLLLAASKAQAYGRVSVRRRFPRSLADPASANTGHDRRRGAAQGQRRHRRARGQYRTIRGRTLLAVVGDETASGEPRTRPSPTSKSSVPARPRSPRAADCGSVSAPVIRNAACFTASGATTSVSRTTTCW